MEFKGALVEYAVAYRRFGQRAKRIIYKSRDAANRRFGLLTHPRPWELYGQDPDTPVCCYGGRECGCNGVTVREEHERVRASVPALEYARIETREVGEWQDAASP